METYSVLFKKGFKYMGIEMSESLVFITVASFSDAVNLIQKRMSKKNENALLEVEAIMLIRNVAGWGEKFTRTMEQSKNEPESICITTIYEG